MRSLKKSRMVTVSLFALIAFVETARAGVITSVSTDISPDATSVPGLNSDGSAFVTITAAATDAGVFQINGTTEGDPTIFLDEVLNNNTGAAWDQYTVTINPGAGSVVSNVQIFAPVHGPNLLPLFSANSNSVTFSGGLVNPGQNLEVNISFDVTANGAFNYTVSNAPVLVPEPASLALLALGGLMLVRRKRHA